MTDSARSPYEAALRRIRTKRQLRRAGVKSVRVTHDVAVVNAAWADRQGGGADPVPTLTAVGAGAFVPALGALCQAGGHLTVRGANQQIIKTLTRMGLASLTGITPPEPPSAP